MPRSSHGRGSQDRAERCRRGALRERGTNPDESAGGGGGSTNVVDENVDVAEPLTNRSMRGRYDHLGAAGTGDATRATAREGRFFLRHPPWTGLYVEWRR